MNKILTSLENHTLQIQKVWRRVMTLKRIIGLIALLAIIGLMASDCLERVSLLFWIKRKTILIHSLASLSINFLFLFINNFRIRHI